MKPILTLLLLLISTSALAKDVHVNGYNRKDGTYVQPHIRSAPDGVKWNNYGRSENSAQLMNPTTRDQDHDGVPNYLDRDDDNDGTRDDAMPVNMADKVGRLCLFEAKEKAYIVRSPEAA